MPLSVSDLAVLVTQYIAVRDRRLDLDRQSDKLKETESAAKAQIIAELANSDANGIAGATHRVTLRKKQVPTATNWREVYDFIKENDAFDLLQMRLSPPAVNERWEAGVAIPGISAVEVLDLSINKL